MLEVVSKNPHILFEWKSETERERQRVSDRAKERGRESTEKNQLKYFRNSFKLCGFASFGVHLRIEKCMALRFTVLHLCELKMCMANMFLFSLALTSSSSSSHYYA